MRPRLVDARRVRGECVDLLRRQYQQLNGSRPGPKHAIRRDGHRLRTRIAIGLLAACAVTAFASSETPVGHGASPAHTYGASAWPGLADPTAPTVGAGVGQELPPAVAVANPSTPAVCATDAAQWSTPGTSSTTLPAFTSSWYRREGAPVASSAGARRSTRPEVVLTADVTAVAEPVHLDGTLRVPLGGVGSIPLGTSTSTTSTTSTTVPRTPSSGITSGLSGVTRAVSGAGSSVEKVLGNVLGSSGVTSSSAPGPPAALRPSETQTQGGSSSGTPTSAQPSEVASPEAQQNSESPFTLSSPAMAQSPFGSSMQVGCQLVADNQVTSAAGGETPTQEAAVDEALTMLGIPYVWGGESKSGFDCSGLVQFVFRSVGVDLPRVAQAQYDAGPAVEPGTPVVPGDLVFFGSSPTGVVHVGIVVGHGLMIDAPYTGAVVRFDPVAGSLPIVGVTSPGGSRNA